MSTQKEEARPEVGRASGSIGGEADNTDDSTTGRQNRPTNVDRVLGMLFSADEVCSSDFYREYLPNFGVAVHRLRRAGYGISKRVCDRHDWHVGTSWLYRLEALPFDPGTG